MGKEHNVVVSSDRLLFIWGPANERLEAESERAETHPDHGWANKDPCKISFLVGGALMVLNWVSCGEKICSFCSSWPPVLSAKMER